MSAISQNPSIMASSFTTTVGGVVVVTQVIPQEQSLITVQAADAHQQASAPAAKAPPPASPSKMDDVAATFQQGEPQALGVRGKTQRTASGLDLEYCYNSSLCV